MFIDTLFLAFTGIIRFPEFARYFLFIYNYLPASKIAVIHDWSGIILAALILVHLILKREGLVKAFIGNYQLSKNAIFRAFIVICSIFLLGSALFLLSNYLRSKQVINLSAVEINDYNGEKLGSVNDFRENSIKGVQYINKESYKLQVSGLVTSPTSYSYNDIVGLPNYKKVVTLNCVEGWSVKALWQGVLVKDILKNSQIDPKATTIIFYAADGYSTSFPLDYVLQNNIMLAYILNGVELPPERGFPFQLVAEQKWGYKWIKWITKIELSSDTNYKGFWESKGYNNDGSLNGSKFSQ